MSICARCQVDHRDGNDHCRAVNRLRARVVELEEQTESLRWTGRELEQGLRSRMAEIDQYIVETARLRELLKLLWGSVPWDIVHPDLRRMIREELSEEEK